MFHNLDLSRQSEPVEAPSLGPLCAWLAAMLSSLGQNLTAVAIVAANITSMLPIPFAGNLGDLALYALGEQSEASLAAAMAIGIIPGGKLASKFASSGIGRFIGRVGASAWGAAKHYASKAGTWLARRIYRDGGPGFSLLDDAANFLKRKPASACGCFAAGTLVWTASGLVPIEQVRVGDFVLAKDEATGELEYRMVTAEIVTERAALLELSLVHESGVAELLRTTDEHPFWVEGSGWVRADSLVPGDVLRTTGSTATISAVGLPSGRTTVYNLSVEGYHTYFVGPDGVWVHNCGEISRASKNFDHSYDRHADEWAKRWGVKMDHDEWLRILQEANRSSVESFMTLRGTRTLAKYARIDGNKPIILHWFAEGPNAGEFATAVIPNEAQVRHFFDSRK